MNDIRTYDGLKEAVADYLAREDLADRIPGFIRMAELRMNRELRLRSMEKVSVNTMRAGDKVINLPMSRNADKWDAFLEMRDLSWNGGENLYYMPPDEYRHGISELGKPREYTIIGNHLFLVPAPDTDGLLTLSYYAEIPALGEERQTNDVLSMYPDLYLYASLVESIPYTRGSVPGEIWREAWNEARWEVHKNESRSRFTANLTMKRTGRV